MAFSDIGGPLYVRDVVAGTNELVSVDNAGIPGNYGTGLMDPKCPV